MSANLFQRSEDGLAIRNGLKNSAYPPIPPATHFQNQNYGYEVPKEIHGWQWSTTFNTWSALVTLDNGWHGFTYPKRGETNVEN